MTLQANIVLLFVIASVVVGYPEPPPKQTAGYGYKLRKEYHSSSHKGNEDPHSYGSNKDDRYGNEQYGKVSVKKYGFKKEYERDDRKEGYGPSDGHYKPAYGSGYRSNKYEPDIYDRRDRSPYLEHKPDAYAPPHGEYDDRSNFHNNKKQPYNPRDAKPHGYYEKPRDYNVEDKKYGPSTREIPHGSYSNNDNDPYSRPPKQEPRGYHADHRPHYETYKKPHSKQPLGYDDDRRGNEPYGPQGYADDSVKGYRPPHNPHGFKPSGYSNNNNRPGQYQPHKQQKHHSGYHKEEYYTDNKKGYNDEPNYDPKPSKKVIYEKHYYGKYNKDHKPERASVGFEADLYTPDYKPHNDQGYHDNGQNKGQLRGYEAALARHKSYQSAPHYD